MGDVGITTKLSAINGYELRIQCVTSESGHTFKAEEGILTQI